VIDKKRFTDFNPGMDLDPGYQAGKLGDQPRQQDKTVLAKEMRHPVEEQGMNTGIAEHHFQDIFCSGVSFQDCFYFLVNAFEHISCSLIKN
jgi:hypothetical protein